MKFQWLLAGVIVSCVIGESLTHAETADWPEFRGPTGQGQALGTGLPLEWSRERNVRWRVQVPGKGWSSPVVGGGRVYVTTAETGAGGNDLSLRVLAYSADGGRLLWNTEVFGPDVATVGSIHGKNSYASPTPVVDGDRLFVHFGHNGTACLDLEGGIVWRNRDLRYPPVHGSGGSPVVLDDKLIFSADGGSDPFIVALDKTNGKVVWKRERRTKARKTFSFSTPLVITVKGVRQVVTAGSGVVSGLKPEDGQEIWRVDYGEGYSVVPRPVFGHGLVFVATGYDRPTVMAIRPDGRGNVTDTHVEWTLARSAPNTPSLLLVQDELYMVSDGGIASCVEARTGRVHWQERVGGNHSASPVFADGRIYFQSEEGDGIVVKAGKEFTKLAVNPLGERCLASYAVTREGFFIRTADHLYRIGR